MNKKHTLIIFFCGLLLTLSGCKKYLQIQPEGTYTEAQVFANESAAQQMLNGLYISMADNNLYGAALTQTVVELMAQRYKTTTSGNGAIYSLYQQYQYSDARALAQFESTWKKAYSTIITANLFLEKIDQSVQNHVITQENCNMMKGEALAVRAMLHFDLLRIFAPAYSLGANQTAIPYNTLADGKAQPILTSTQVLDKVLEDLTAAEVLLTNDPVIKTGVVAGTETDFYTGSRNQRLNYYAIKALKARVYLWGGKKTEAHDAALAALTDGETWFPWLDRNAISGTNNPDRIFSTEVLFAVYNSNLYINYANFFSTNLLDDAILAAEPTNLKNTFENNENDYRYTTTWVQTNRDFRTFYKYDGTSSASGSKFLQPLIRKSELYYILAETEADPDLAVGYLNTVRANRGLPSLTSDVQLPTEIMKEYRKEFYGEGQLFFYYKRNNTATIPDGISSTATKKPVYLVPLPLSETTPR